MISLLKGRFRRLGYVEMNKVELIPKIVMSCCILHNICLSGQDCDVELDAVCDDISPEMNADSVQQATRSVALQKPDYICGLL